MKALVWEGPRVMTMHDVPEQHYGLGTYSMTVKGKHVVMHGGALPGVSTILLTVPDEHLVIAVLANVLGPFANDAARGALESLLDLPEGPDPVWTTPATTWQAYIGRYDDPYGKLGSIEVTFEQGALFLTLHGDRSEALPSTLSGDFVAGPTGAIEFFVTRQGVARRRPAPAAQ